ncbi:FecCD family ABC transporter permease [Aestuariibius sp. 2305UL40-4]|uniref:FecCD family ABC transporter permease n=1 Tax=Aestuariibius violaceus TaxID=3234132 RepID=UPI00345E659E
MTGAALLLRRRLPSAAWVLPPILAALFLMGLGLGASFLPPDRVFAALTGTGVRSDGIIVWNLRMPRVLMAMLAGGALGLAGFLLQRATRNPLAAPATLGIVDGAALGVLTFLWAFSDEANALTVPILWQPAAAAAGALIFAAAVAWLARRDLGGPLRLILYGIALGALADALVTLMMVAGPVYRAGQALIWLAGSVHTASWFEVTLLSSVVAVALVGAVPLMRPLDNLRCDDATAAAQGVNVMLTRGAAIGLAVLLTAAAVSVAGGIGFVGLVAPHLARRIAPSGTGAQALTTLGCGAGIVAAADILARLAFAPLEIPTGAVTAMIGVPVLLLLLLRGRG